MDIKGLVDKLHSLERKVLPLLNKYVNFDDLVKNSSLQEVEVMRALQWLENKEVVKINSKEVKTISLTEKAKVYKELPERTILNSLSDKETTLEELKNKTKLNDTEINATIGLLKKKASIDIQKDKTLKIRLNENGKKLVNKKTPEEELFIQIPNHNNYYKTERITNPPLNQSKKIRIDSIYKNKKNTIITISQTYLLNENQPCDFTKLREWADTF